MTTMMKKAAAALLCLSMSAAVFTGCGNSTNSSETEAKKNSASEKTQLLVGTELTSNTLDPADEWNSWFVMRWGVLETLTRFADDGTIEPWLASDWTVSEDKLTWTFTLKDGLTFSDGCKVTASAVVSSLERLFDECDPEKGGNGNAQSYFKYTEIKADDKAGTVSITTDGVVVDLPGCLAYPWYGVVDTEHTEDYDNDPVCTGPYVIVSNDPDHDIQLKRNDNYWDGEVPFDTVSILVMAEASTRAMALQDGSVDMALSISSADRNLLEEQGGYLVDVTSGNRMGTAFINFDGVLGNDALRTAVFMAIDGQTICDVTTNGSYTYTNNAPLPSNYDYGYDSLDFKYGYDPEKAKSLLDEAGIVDTDGDGYRELDGTMIDLRYVGSTSRQQDVIAQAQAAQLDEIGIKCTVTFPENANDQRVNQEFDLLYNNEVSMPTGDPANYLLHWYKNVKDTTINYGNYQNEAFDAEYEKLAGETDMEKRKEIFKNLQQIMIDDVASICYGSYNFNICATSAVEGVHSYTCDYYWVTKDIKPAK
ncbi:MAG: ABC transporter substrate-binding protein [Lachnospiraceae bacterium]|nr:ABC transporter substrate-binding protein [Lachnospiraceae bacterium]